MASLVRMPEVAASATSAVLLAWNKQVGEAVAVGDVLAEIESDKAVVEYTAEEAGTIGHLFLAAGAEAEVGAPIAILLAPGETAAEVAALMASLGAEGTAQTVASAEVVDAAVAASAPVSQSSARVFARPLARRLARERGIDLAGVSGSGPRG
ncbi:MAG TPA: E3 binding domain-containing protein, partial [Luteimonas sp.]|nr:E3 binding domain-containing protein [Luteimonas sp.]